METIAHYRITSKLGEGGMGEVYRATDTKLNREVAIKVIPEFFAQDPDRMARFTREAQVLASLNHPNIAVIHGVEERAIVMELVEGESGTMQVFVRPFPASPAGGRWQISTGGAFPLWSRNSRELFYVTGSDARIMVAGYTVKDNSFAADKPRTWSPAPIPRSGILLSYDLAPDGKRFVTFQVPVDQQDEKGSVHVTVLLNFFDELRRRMP